MSRKLLRTLLLIVLIMPLNIVLARPQSSLSDAPPALEFTEVMEDLSSPVSMTHAGDSSGRLFITQLDGQILIYDGSQVLATPFLNIAPLVVSGGEQGLLSVAFDPDYSTNGYFYVFYTREPDEALQVVRYEVSSGDPNVADATSASIVITIPHSEATNHNGGQLQFGPDGYLYIGTGDGGTGGEYSQDGTSLLGKILRIDVTTVPYTIPPSNPFVANASVGDEVWALGLRNPWRFSFDSLTGDLIIADVGQGNWEEINVQPAASTGGENYGWPCYEGLHNRSNPSACTTGTITTPVTEYDHGFGCSVTGGYRYRGSEFPNLYGVYLFGDFCSGRIWGAEPNGTPWTSVNLEDTAYGISAFGEGENGELYVTDYFNGRIYQISTTVFSDVPSSYWARQYIETLYQAGITGGCSTAPLNYCPDNIVTRDQMAVFLERGIHGSSFFPPNVSPTFNDTAGNFAEDWIEALKNDGITAGCGTNIYCPSQGVTRAQMAIFLERAMHGASFTPPNVTPTFNDTAGNFAEDWIEALKNDGVTAGCGGGSYCPDAIVTRAQMAVFLVIAFGLP